MPHDLPSYRIASHYFRAWQKDGTWDTTHDTLREKVRLAAGKKPKPTAAILDSQSVKSTEQGGPRAGKKSPAASGSWRWWGWVGVVVKKLVGQVGFVVQPKRWIVERTFGWVESVSPPVQGLRTNHRE